jgi:hypothetical protein
MKLLAVEAREVVIILEETLPNLKKLKLAMDITELNYDPNNKEESEAAKFLTSEFYPYISNLLKELEKEHGD